MKAQTNLWFYLSKWHKEKQTPQIWKGIFWWKNSH